MDNEAATIRSKKFVSQESSTHLKKLVDQCSPAFLDKKKDAELMVLLLESRWKIEYYLGIRGFSAFRVAPMPEIRREIANRKNSFRKKFHKNNQLKVDNWKIWDTNQDLRHSVEIWLNNQTPNWGKLFIKERFIGFLSVHDAFNFKIRWK